MGRRRDVDAALALAACAALVGLPSAASAFDVELDSDTSFQIYEVRSPGAGAFMARRRLLSRLSLRLAHDLTEPDDEGRALRLTAEAQLRIEQDFGETCLVDRDLCVNALDADDPSAWQPLAADTQLDVPAVWGELSGLPLGTSARLGRQLVLDSIGLARFDGVSARVVPVRWVRAEALAGLLVRGTSLAGTSRSDPAGSMRLQGAERIPWAAAPVDTWVAGGSVEGGPGRWLQLRLAYRHMWEPDGDVVSRASGAVSSQPVGWLRFDASGVWDLLSSEAIASSARVSVGEGELVVAGGIARHVPRFDPGTIWAWFAVAPITQADVGATWRPSTDVSIGGSLRGRHAELGDANADDLDAGVDGWLRARVEGIEFGASGFLWSGSLGPLAGVSLDASRQFFGWMRLALDVSVWHFDDPSRADLYGTVLSEALSGRFRLSPETQILAELQHATSRVVGHRFRGIVAVRVDTWR